MSSPDEFYGLDKYADLEALDNPDRKRTLISDGVLLVRHKHRYNSNGLCVDCPKRQPTPVLHKEGDSE